MSEIKYHHMKTCVAVFLDGKRTGTIKSTSRGYHYVPKGKSGGGEFFPTLRQCKDSLEMPDDDKMPYDRGFEGEEHFV